MIGVQSYAAKAAAAVERNRAALARSTAKLTEHDRARPAGDDADAVYQWRRDQRDLEDRVASDREAVAHAEARAEEARVAEEMRAADAAHATEERQVAMDARKLPRAVEESIEETIAKIEALLASNERTTAYNAQRGERPFIVDAETRARQRPARTIPAEYRDEVVWEDGAGNRPSVFRQNADGEMVPQAMGFTRKTVSVCVSPERVIPPEMPPRLAELLPILRRAVGK